MSYKNLYKIFGVLWRVVPNAIYGNDIFGPYCPNCKTDLKYHSLNEAKCDHCEKAFKLPHSQGVTKKQAYRRYQASVRSGYPVVSLDTPPTKVKAYSEDKNYFIRAHMTQKDGRRIAVVYVGEKSKKQSKKDYSHIFIDLDQQQIRYDTTNKMPDEFLTALVCEFKNNTTSTRFKKSSKDKRK